MKIKTYQYSSIKDSSLLYKKKVPPYIFILIGLVLAILIGAIIWSNFSIKADVVKQNGIIAAKDKVNLNCSVNSTITKINFKEGEQVKVGDSIIEFSTNEIDANVIQTKQLYETCKFNEESFNKLIDYIENNYAIDEPGKCFDPTNHSELQFYNYQLSFILNYGSLTGDVLKQAKTQYFNQTIIPLRDDTQMSSFELQQENYQNLLGSHPNCDLRHIYAGEGISGTS